MVIALVLVTDLLLLLCTWYGGGGDKLRVIGRALGKFV